MDGMAIVTHESNNNDYPCFTIFKAHNSNYGAPINSPWLTNYYTPSSDVFDEWKNIGSVFGIAIDNNKNIYLSSSQIAYSSTYTSVGPAGSAGIYKLDNDDWSVTNFITTGNGTNQINNSSGIGIGNICFNKFHNQLLLTNLEDGKIYRYDLEWEFIVYF